MCHFFFMASVEKSEIQRFILFFINQISQTQVFPACIPTQLILPFLQWSQKMRPRSWYLQKTQLKHSQGKFVLSKLAVFHFAHWPCVLFQTLLLFTPLMSLWSCRVSAGVHRSRLFQVTVVFDSPKASLRCIGLLNTSWVTHVCLFMYEISLC